jgi:hypothetical protein
MRSLLAVMAFAVLAHILWTSESTDRTPAALVIDELPRARRIVVAERERGKTITRHETKFADVLMALEKNSPHGRSWEELEQDDFIAEVNNWSEEILIAAELDLGDPNVKKIGHLLYSYQDPYWKYLGYSLISRTHFKTRLEMEDAVMMLGEHPSLEDYALYPETEESVSHERVVRHKLINGLLNHSAYRIVQQLKQEKDHELWVESMTRIKTYAEKLPSKRAEFAILAAVESI